MKDTEKKHTDKKDMHISRRDVILGIGAAATSTIALSGNAMADMKEHDHSKPFAKQHGVLEASSNCTDKGEKCIAHCLADWNKGNLELSECANKVNEMNAICGAFTNLLASNSSYVNATAKICSSVCKECAEECRKHEHHPECRECAEACEDLVKAIDKDLA